MKLFNPLEFLTDILEKEEKDREEQEAALDQYLKIRNTESRTVTGLRETNNRQFKRILELTSNPVVLLRLNDLTLKEMITAVQDEITSIEYGSLKWHYLQGKLEGLNIIDTITQELPEYTVENK